MHFLDRRNAGRRLGAVVAELDLPDPTVLALPRGGVPAGFEVARADRVVCLSRSAQARAGR